MILRFLFFIQTFLKYCKALSTEKYQRYINILLYYYIIHRNTCKQCTEKHKKTANRIEITRKFLHTTNCLVL